MLKKIFLLIFSAILLTACCNKNDNTVVFSTWGSITEIQVIKKIISDFEKENPDIKIELLHIPQNYFQKLHLLFASNTAPDVIFINNLYLPIYSKYLEDLSNVIKKDEYYSISLQTLTQNKKILAFPRDISSLVFYVNLDKTHLPNPNWKLNDLIESNLNNKFIVSFEDDIYWALPYLAYFSNVNLTNGLDEDEISGLKFYKSLRDEYKIAPTKSEIGSSTLAQMFLDRKINFYLSGRWMYPKIQEKANFNWAVINFPYGKYPQTVDASGWAINKNSKNKANAIKFAQYLSSKQAIEYFTQTGLIVPARIDNAKQLDNNQHNERIFLEVLNYSKPTIINKNYKKIVDKINLEYFN